jgi:hypothetical protein
MKEMLNIKYITIYDVELPQWHKPIIERIFLRKYLQANVPGINELQEWNQSYWFAACNNYQYKFHAKLFNLNINIRNRSPYSLLV